METSRHRLIVSDTLLVRAFHDANQFVRQLQLALLHHLIVTNDVHTHIRSYYSNTVDFIIRKKLVSNLDDTLLTQQLTVEVIANGDIVGQMFQTQQ